MSRHIDKAELISKVREMPELTNDEKSALLELLNEKKTYGLVWENHEEAVEEQLREQLPVLREVPERRIISEDADAPNHIIIEAENLHALVALTYTHAGMIDVMYFDPPYNTGDRDFIYNDSFIGVDDTYRHSKWLSFMEKRLVLAKSILAFNGIILISINDIELYNLKLLCDKIFGERNFVANFIWQSTPGSNTGDDIKTVTEYVLAYSKDISSLKVNKLQIVDDDKYTLQDEFVERRGKYTLNKLDRRMTGSHYSDALNYSIPLPNGSSLFPGGKDFKQEHWNWRWSKAKVEWGIKNGFVVFKKNNNGWAIYFKQYLLVNNNDEPIERSLPYQNLIKDAEGMNSARGTQEVMELFNRKAFDYPKPISLLHHLLKCTTKKDSHILDIFAGSGTTLHATMQLNAEDGSHRQCILVTNNENNICEQVTYERNKRVIQGYTTPKGEQVEGLTKNNLRYYKADFISRDSSSKNKRELVKAATDLLCIKEGLYQEAKITCQGKTLRKDYARRFSAGNKEMIIIYEPAVIKYIVEELKSWDKKEFIKIYVFSEGRYAYDDDFKEVLNKVTLCALPDAVYQAYRRVLPRRKKDKLASIDINEDEQAEALADAEHYSYKEEKGGEA